MKLKSPKPTPNFDALQTVRTEILLRIKANLLHGSISKSQLLAPRVYISSSQIRVGIHLHRSQIFIVKISNYNFNC